MADVWTLMTKIAMKPTQNFFPVSRILGLACVLIPFALASRSNGADGVSDEPNPSTDRYARIAQDLESPKYKIRVAASHQLRSGGRDALPSLQKAIVDGRPEAVMRSLEVISWFQLGDDVELSNAASQTLSELLNQVSADRRNQIVGRLRRLETKRDNECSQRLIALGAAISTGGPITVTLTRNWRGGTEALKYLRYIRGLHTLNMSNSGLGDDALSHLAPLSDVEVLRIKANGPGLVHLQKMKSLTFLSLKGSELQPQALKFLEGCEQMQYLGLDETNASNEDLTDLRFMPHLRQLWLNNTAVTDEGLVHLEPLKEIEKIIFTGIKLKGPGLEHLSALEKLDYVSFQHVKFDDQAMESIHYLDHVRVIGLDDAGVTDAGMKHLASLTMNLEELWLNNTDVSDVSIVHLKKLAALKKLMLNGAKLSQQGVEELKTALPNCRVKF